MRGLIIRAPWIDLILDGKKTWEMRTKRTKVRGQIALIRQGSNAVVGTADLIDSREPLSRETYMSFQDRHAVPQSQLDQVLDSNWIYPWVLTNVCRLSSAVPFSPKSGPVTFTVLDGWTSQTIIDQIGARPDYQVKSVLSPAGLKPTPSPTLRLAPEVADPNLVSIAEVPSEMPIFTFRPENAQAFGRPDDGGFVVLANSTAVRHGSPNVKRDRECRDTLVRIGVLVPDKDTRLYRFTRDHRFDSSSRAAGIIKDGNASGPSLWRDEATGHTLRDHNARF